MKQQYLVNVDRKDVRVAVLEDGKLVQLLIEVVEEGSILGNIYKALVSDLKPGIHAAFVDIGLGRNAFLHFDDIHPDTVAFSSARPSPSERPAGRDRDLPRDGSNDHSANRSKFDPAKNLHPGDSLLVQVIKEEIGQKGPRVTSHVSLPGRYLVLLPFAKQEGGISRKIEDARERRRLRKILREINRPDRGYIVRTAGLDRPAEEIKSDVGFLDRTWRAIRRKYRLVGAPSLIYDDRDILYRVARDVISSTADEIWVDSRREFLQLQRCVRKMVPGIVDRVRSYTDPLKNIFDEFEIEKQIQKALRRKVWLPSGGHLIFDEMEAMTAIDVNTGKYTGGRDQAKTVYRTNLEAAREIAHQLRLRDIGGLIVIDFIDMENKQYQKNLTAEFKRLLARDKAKTAVLNISEFGLVEMTRKRVRQSLKGFFFADCPVCGGSGEALTREQVWRNIRRDLVSRLSTPRRPSLEVKAHPSQREYIQSEHGDVLRNWQSRFKIEIRLVGEPTFLPEQYQLCELPRKTEPQGPGRSSPRLVEVSQQPAIAVADQTPSTS